MSFGFPAHAEGSWHFEADPAAIAEAVEQALLRLGWDYQQTERGHWQATIPWNFWSWGEVVELELGADGTLAVRSRCTWVLQCFDWGKNRQNVKRVLGDLRANPLLRGVPARKTGAV